MIKCVISININIRNMVSCFIVLLHLMRVVFDELNEFLPIVVHPCIVLIFHLVANVILDVRTSCIQVRTSCILKLFFFNDLLLLLERLSLV
jgi:hypothetical protein